MTDKLSRMQHTQGPEPPQDGGRDDSQLKIPQRPGQRGLRTATRPVA